MQSHKPKYEIVFCFFWAENRFCHGIQTSFDSFQVLYDTANKKENSRKHKRARYDLRF